jgi:RIO kinase 1
LQTIRNFALSRIDSNFELYEDRFNPSHNDRKAHRARKPKHYAPKKSERQMVDDVADATATEGGFKISYTPARHETIWLLESLQTFFDQDVLTDVMALIKGGKEANVYRCEGKLSSQELLIAAKVYRPKMFRNLRNDKMYREGRELLTEQGRVVKTSDHRIMRAVGKKTAFGAQVAHTSWLMYEYTTLKRLFDAGAAVPQPYMVSENSILMEYIGDEHGAAPTLHEVRIDPDEAKPLFFEVMRNIELMLKHSMIHGDLSAYNILYWEGKITFIDFPQVTNPQTNRNAHEILKRDIERVCEYFAKVGVYADHEKLTSMLWEKYTYPDIPELDERFDPDDL